jgi:hypothetical protein
MGLLSWTIGLPLQPVRGVVALGGVIQQQVEQEEHSAPSVRRRLEELEQAQEQDPGSVSEEQEREALEEITSARVRATTPETPGGGER